MFYVKIFRAPAVSKAFPSRSLSLHLPPHTLSQLSTAQRVLHQRFQTQIPLQGPSSHSRTCNHVFVRGFSTKFPLRQQRYRFPPESESEISRGKAGGNYGYKPNSIRSRFGTYTPLFLLGGGGATIFYISHLETVPVSGRRRFNCYSETSAEKQGEMAYQQIIAQGRHDGNLVPESDRRVVQVKRVLKRLIEGGQLGSGNSGSESSWEVNVIDQDEANAFVLPGGKVFVFTGILPITQNDEGLAAVLGHEIAHNLAHHSAERMSGAIVVQILVILASIGESAFLGGDGRLSRWLADIALDFGVMRPASRQQESEADFIGLLLMAQSCYDPKAAVGLWERMEKASKGAPPQWLSTHPSNESRIKHITEWLPKAEEKREESGCSATIEYARDFQNTVGSFW